MPDRREILRRSLALAAAGFLAPAWSRAKSPARFSSHPFTLGVAAGSPVDTGFVLWTRLAPEPANCMSGDLDYLLGNFPLAQALPKIFQGTGDCAKVEWSLFGLSIAEWAFVWFLLFVATATWLALFRKRPAAVVA